MYLRNTNFRIFVDTPMILLEKNYVSVSKNKPFCIRIEKTGGSGRTRICDLTLIRSSIKTLGCGQINS